MSERIADERLAELLAEEKEIAESDHVLQLEAGWAAEVAQALTELTERRERESASGVQYALKWSNGELNPNGVGSGTTLVDIRHRARQEQLSDPYNERPAVLRRSVTFGQWEEVVDDDE